MKYRVTQLIVFSHEKFGLFNDGECEVFYHKQTKNSRFSKRPLDLNSDRKKDFQHFKSFFVVVPWHGGSLQPATDLLLHLEYQSCLIIIMITTFLGPVTCQRSLDFNISANEDFQNSMAQLRYIAYRIIGPTLIVAGIIGNILNLIVLSRPFLNDCTRIYLRALAIADINVLIFEISIIIRLNDIQHCSLPVAIYHAHFELVLLTTFLAFNVYIVMCLTIDRYVSVCVPIMFNVIHTKEKAKIFLVVCLVVAIIVSLPLFMLKTVCHNEARKECHAWNSQENILVTHTAYWKTYIIISEIFIRIGPALVLAILNMLIIKKFRVITQKRNKFHLPTHQCQYSNSSASTTLKSGYLRTKKYQEEKRLIILLQAVIILFFITMIPSSCLSLIYSEAEEFNLTYQIFRAVANLLEIANSSLNFCAYFLCSKEFRRGLLAIFTGCCNKSVQNNNTRNTDANGVRVVSIETISNDFVHIPPNQNKIDKPNTNKYS